ncbi:MAG TPA: hypothetical protein VMW42_06915 [Desulfatiglandales bacterium]|nr:hypothetical protein [Desulfatiglandales bacterium]
MSTTALFFEILIIGIQALIWILLFVLAFVGPVSLGKTIQMMEPWQMPLSVALMAAAYTVGLILDRLADACFMAMKPLLYSKPKAVLLRSLWVQDRVENAGLDERMKVLSHEGRSVEFLEYIRSRLRIVRATFLNILLILIALTVLICRISTPAWKPLFILWVIGLFVIICVYFSWAMLQLTYEDRLVQAYQSRSDSSEKTSVSISTKET